MSSLRPHEETIPAHVEKLSSEMTRDRVQKDPIIIDRDSATVLDGMHRLAAFTALGIENAVCCSVDYSSSAVTLGRWARVYKMVGGDAYAEVLRPSGITRKTPFAEAFEALESRDSGLTVLTSGSAFLPEGGADLSQAMGVVSAIDKIAYLDGWQRTFVPEEDVDVALQSRQNLVVLVRRLTKEEVVSAGRSGRLFPCKTSMHHIDPRPVAVNFPIAMLNSATSGTLRDSLKDRRERILPADSVYEGRRYKERLLLLDRG